MKPIVTEFRAWTIVLSLLLGACSSAPEIRPDPDFGPVEAEIADVGPGPVTGSLYDPNRPLELFQDRKAYRVGDLLTVVLSEATNASTSASTTTQKDDEFDMPAPTLLGGVVTRNGRSVLENSIAAERAFSGSGDTNQSNSLQGRLTVMVAKVYPSGNLLVRGEKILSINQGSEYVRVAGIVRPQDINPDNTLQSSKIANARIAYGGNGVVNDANAPGWLSRFFNSAYWPF